MKKLIILLLFAASSAIYGSGYMLEFSGGEEGEAKVKVLGDVDMPFDGDQRFTASSSWASVAYELVSLIAKRSDSNEVRATLTDCSIGSESSTEVIFFHGRDQPGVEYLKAYIDGETVLVWLKP